MTEIRVPPSGPVLNYGASLAGAQLVVFANGDVGPLLSDFQSVSALELSTDLLTAFPTSQVVLQPSRIYQAELDVAVQLYTDLDHSVNGAIDFTIQCSIATDVAGAGTVVFNTVAVPNISLLPVGLAGASATIAAAPGGFIVSCQRPAGVASHATFNASWSYPPRIVT